jgi:ADP-dependent NAD(P)H-hydrate dehydratase / NAD(P)H-hydrate epimerase
LSGVFGVTDVALPTAAEAAAADAAAREQFGIAQEVLMESAGRAAALVLERVFPRGRVVGVAGSGNNGGDLLVMLRLLQAWGRDVTLIAAGSRPPDARLAHGFPMQLIRSDDDSNAAYAALAGADVVIDGMLGTGTTGAPRGAVADWIRRINGSGRPVLALDLPSGVDATSGAVAADAVRAALTVTFGWPKLGLLLHPARQYCGRLVAVEIGFPDGCLVSTARAITGGAVRRGVAVRAATAHKGSAGRLLILAGNSGMAGAAALAGEAAVRAGAGLVRIASPPDNRQILQTLVPEATFFDSANLDEAAAGAVHALVAGPGLGTDAAAHAALRRVLGLTAGVPTLLDADALNLYAADSRHLASLAGERPLVITPHAGELARLTGQGVDDIVADAPHAARAAAAAFGCVVLLKGQPSLVASADGGLLVNTVGSSDTASAGMGDQLAGTIGALLAGGVRLPEAAAFGLYLSGRAADLAALGRSLSPRDVSARLHEAIADPGPLSSALALPFVTFDQPARH